MKTVDLFFRRRETLDETELVAEFVDSGLWFSVVERLPGAVTVEIGEHINKPNGCFVYEGSCTLHVQSHEQMPGEQLPEILMNGPRSWFRLQSADENGYHVTQARQVP